MMDDERRKNSPDSGGLMGPQAGVPEAEQPTAACAEQQVADEQLREVWAHARVGGAVSALFAVLLALKFREGHAPALWLDAWLVAKLAVTACRSALAWRPRASVVSNPHGLAVVDGWLFVDGALWGALGAVLMQVEATLAALVGAALVGIASAAVLGLQVRFRSTLAYVVPMLLPTALSLMWRGDDFGLVGGAGLGMLLVLQMATARHSAQRLGEGMLLRLQAQALVREKEEALQLAHRQSAVKTQFLANISHELRTPLHGILGLTRLLLHEPPGGAATAAALRLAERHQLGLIESSGTHLLALINDLLDISRIEAGRFVMRREPFELNAQIEQVAGVHAVRARDKGLGFEWSAGLPEPCWVEGDAARFRQVLHNLLGNAVKFTELGVVTLVARQLGADRFEVEVRDSGPGIAEAELPQVFEAFNRSATATAEGAGLGLAIARDIARQMDGDLHASSSVGSGTTLRFTAVLPASQPPAVQRDALGAQPPPALKGMRVLVAEDDEVNALIVLAYLTQLGAHGERVADGAAALQPALRETQRPELLLLDCRMPVMDGYSAARAIRRREAELGLLRLPILALTATAGDDDRQACLEAGMDDFLAKPYTRDQLAAMLARWRPPLEELRGRSGLP